MAQIIGTFEDETLIGTAFTDYMVGDLEGDLSGDARGGDDRISGLQGSDRIYGDASGIMLDESRGGDDQLYGGAGDDDPFPYDAVFGDADAMQDNARGGDDLLFGEDGDDAPAMPGSWSSTPRAATTAWTAGTATIPCTAMVTP